MSVFNVMRLLIFLLTGLAVFGFQVEQEAEDQRTITLSIQVPPPGNEATYNVNQRAIKVPVFQDADWVYFPSDHTLRPLIAIPIVLPPEIGRAHV